MDIGKATIARITAARLGCKDEAMLDLIGQLASSEIIVGTPQLFGAGYHESTGVAAPEPFYSLAGTMNGKPFLLTLSGPAVAAFKEPV